MTKKEFKQMVKESVHEEMKALKKYIKRTIEEEVNTLGELIIESSKLQLEAVRGRKKTIKEAPEQKVNRFAGAIDTLKQNGNSMMKEFAQNTTPADIGMEFEEPQFANIPSGVVGTKEDLITEVQAGNASAVDVAKLATKVNYSSFLKKMGNKPGTKPL